MFEPFVNGDLLPARKTDIIWGTSIVSPVFRGNAMQLTVNLGYDQVFDLAHQLTPEEQKRLAQSLLTFDAETEKNTHEMTQEEYYEFLMNFPVISEEEIQLMLEAKKEVDKIRQEAL